MGAFLRPAFLVRRKCHLSMKIFEEIIHECKQMPSFQIQIAEPSRCAESLLCERFVCLSCVYVMCVCHVYDMFVMRVRHPLLLWDHLTPHVCRAFLLWGKTNRSHKIETNRPHKIEIWEDFVRVSQNQNDPAGCFKVGCLSKYWKVLLYEVPVFWDVTRLGRATYSSSKIPI